MASVKRKRTKQTAAAKSEAVASKKRGAGRVKSEKLPPARDDSRAGGRLHRRSVPRAHGASHDRVVGGKPILVKSTKKKSSVGDAPAVVKVSPRGGGKVGSTKRARSPGRLPARPAAKPAAKLPAKPAARPAAKPAVKPAAKSSAKPAARLPVKPAAKPAAKSGKPARQLSQHPEAIRARERRSLARALAQQVAGAAAERRERRAALERERRTGVVDVRRVSVDWLREIRKVVADHFRCSLSITRAERGSATTWVVVGRYDVLEDVNYLRLGAALHDVGAHVVLETRIHPHRMSQIRVVYADPRGRRGEGDSIVSRIGGWEFVVADIVGEIMGSGPDDRDALAVRYEETLVPTFYVYFSDQIVNYVTKMPWQRVPIR